MAIYDLNEIVTSAALGMYKDKWQHMDFEQVLHTLGNMGKIGLFSV